MDVRHRKAFIIVPNFDLFRFSVVTRRVSKVSQNLVATGQELGLKYPSSPTK